MPERPVSRGRARDETATHATQVVLDDLAAQASVTPAQILAEAMTYTLQRLPTDTYLGILLCNGHTAA